MKTAPFAAVVNRRALRAKAAAKAVRNVLTDPAARKRPSVRTVLHVQTHPIGRNVLTGPLVPKRPTGRIVRIGLARIALTAPAVLTTAA